MKTNEEYHTNRTHLSSSILKLLLTDLDKFYSTWVLNESQGTKPAFQEGSLTHSLILEPHTVNERYAFYSGLRRAGKDYEAFLAENPGKEILLASTRLKAERHVVAIKSLPPAMELIQNSEYEFNMVSEIMGVPVKARADIINVERGLICDVKTTSLPSDVDIFRSTVTEFMYNLSAALYCRIAQEVYGKSFDFYWIVVSKLDGKCEVYKAKQETLKLGHELLNKALLLYRQFEKAGKNLDALRTKGYNVSTGSASLYEILEV